MRAGLLPIGDECWSWDHVTAVCTILGILTCLDTDYAKVKNGVGFSKADTGLGHSLAAKAQDGGLNRSQLISAKWMLRKYRRQIDPDLYRMIYPDHDHTAAA